MRSHVKAVRESEGAVRDGPCWRSWLKLQMARRGIAHTPRGYLVKDGRGQVQCELLGWRGCAVARNEARMDV